MACIAGIIPGSIADELHLEPGDKVVKINNQIIEDQIIYRYLEIDDYIELEIKKCNGEHLVYEIEKELDEDLGIIFSDATFNGIKRCQNNCIFCFVDQMPKNLRKSLYIKDDDYRYSFLFGNFITLTNLKECDLKRIVDLKLSPLYVSVHTTNPTLRAKILGNKSAGRIMEQLKFLVENGIIIHAQAVLVPGVNDGKELMQTIKSLASLCPGVASLAVVPVGLTNQRLELEPLQTFNRDKAADVLKIVEDFQHNFLSELKTRFVFVADEFFILAREKLPEDSYYEDYLQLENGVGIARLFIDEFKRLLKITQPKVDRHNPIIIVTGKSAEDILKELILDLQKIIPDINVNVLALENNFFGHTVTVAGLLTGQDLINGLNKAHLAKNTRILIPDVMLKDGELFLDDLKLGQVRQQLHYKLQVVSNTAKGLLDAILE
ncbi:DUF512 domain-containing protein [Bacillota bacterium LX-D]|nr:DUF512 domain-containing protein [Bacillota bacterium LX-D]